MTSDKAMGPLRFEGHSDDTFGEYGRTNVDDDDCGRGSIRCFEVRSGDHVLRVLGQYAPEGTPGCWWIGIQADDDAPLPPWPMRFERGERDYSPSLVVEAPDDATVEIVEVRR